MAEQGLLFNFPAVGNKQDTKQLIQKTTQKRKAPITVTGSANKIETIISMAKSMLSKNEQLEMLLLTDKQEIINYFDKAVKNGIITIDTETTSLDVIQCDIAGICLHTPGMSACYISIGHINYITGTPLNTNVDKKFITQQLQRLVDNKVKLIFHNAKFDIRVIKWQLGITLKPYWCTQIAGNILNENEPHGLKYLYERYCGSGDTSHLDTFEKLFKGVPFTSVPPEVGYLYAAKDSLMTYELYLFQSKYLNSTGKLAKMYDLFMNIEMRVLPYVAEMEDTGVKIDTEFGKKLSDKYNAQLVEIDNKIKTEIGKLNINYAHYPKLSNPINIASPTQLAILLYDILELKSPDKKSPRGTGEEILNKFNLPLCKLILEYRGVAKLVTTYIDKLPKCINPKTNKLHCQFNQYGAKTGRFSSSDPNLQNIPSHNHEIRQMFVADDGYYFVGGDFSQQEVKVFAHMSNEKQMIQAYKEGKDIYALMASIVYKIDYEECKEFRPDGSTNPEGKQRRSNMKSVVLGLLYGRGVNSIAEQTGMSVNEAQAIVDSFFDTFPTIKKFVDDSQQHARDYGYVETAYHRKRRLPDIRLPKYEITLLDKSPAPANVVQAYTTRLDKAWGRDKKSIIAEAREQGFLIKDNGGFIAQAERQCVNSIIQGSSADITKKAIIAIFENKRLNELGFKLCLTIHDEVIGICPKENAKECGQILSKTMINCCTDKISVPMSVDCSITAKWYGEEIRF